MKKIILTLVLCCFGVAMFAQGAKFGITAGLNVSNITGDVSNTKYKAGFQAGVVADFGITNNFSIIPELLYSQKGYKIDGAGDLVGATTETLNYLVLPINAAYKIDAGYGSKVIVFAGPYLGYGISANNNLKFGSNASEIKPLDFGVNVGLGYQYEKIFFKLQYNLGLASMSNATNASIKNSNIGVTVGYMF